MGRRLKNLLPSIILFLVVAVFRFKYPVWVVLFGLGAIIGSFILKLEGIIYCILLEPEEQISKDVSLQMGNKNYKEVLRILRERKDEIRNRVFHSFLFQIVFAVLTLYVLTSTTSAVASGICIFAFLHLLIDQAVDLKTGNLYKWRGFFGLMVPLAFQKIWFGGGFLALLYFVYILVR